MRYMLILIMMFSFVLSSGCSFFKDPEKVARDHIQRHIDYAFEREGNKTGFTQSLSSELVSNKHYDDGERYDFRIDYRIKANFYPLTNNVSQKASVVVSSGKVVFCTMCGGRRYN